ILLARENHKGIVIGTGGQRLREIGRHARLELERLLATKVFLELFVKVEPGWAGNPRRPKELGLGPPPRHTRCRPGCRWSRSSADRTSVSRRCSTGSSGRGGRSSTTRPA